MKMPRTEVLKMLSPRVGWSPGTRVWGCVCWAAREVPRPSHSGLSPATRVPMEAWTMYDIEKSWEGTS